MKKSSLRFLLPILAVFTLLAESPLEAFWDGSYRNDRFGFSVAVPAPFGMDPAPDNDDGRRFFDREGCSITVYGSHNVLDATVASEMEDRKSFSFDSVTYERKGKDWFVLSGFKDDDIVYSKVFVGDTLITLHISYPADLKADYDETVASVVKSFKRDG